MVTLITLLLWVIHMQTVVAKSSTKQEYRTKAPVICEFV